MMENKNILDMDAKVFIKIKNILEDQNVRDSFLEVLPSEYCSSDLLTLIDVEGYKPNTSPAKYLLFYLGSRGICISDLIKWFEEMHLEKALVLLKNDEPLKIIQQPEKKIMLCEGAELIITCEAIAYPPPEYQWFKDEEILLVQDESTLSITNVRSNDSGIYYCCVMKKNTKTGDYFRLLSDPAEVTVKSDIAHFEEHQNPKILNKNNFNKEEDSSLENNNVISILRHPYVRGKVGQGMSICLYCEAESFYPFQYQWYRDGRALCDEMSTKLELKHLYPHSVTGDSKWKYQCMVYNEYDHIFSKPAIVELDDVDETTCFFAEEKIAFMVANDTYHNLEELKKPAVDVVDLARLLSSMDFKIFAFWNINLTVMKNALQVFCRTLQPNVYALFYFAGHGFEVGRETYLLPVDCSKDFSKDEAICVEYVLKCMQDQNPAINVLLIDACRQLPPISKFEHSFSFKEENTAKMKGNTFCGYSTSYLYSSYESDAEANSFFTKYLKKYLKQNKKIQDILILVQQDLKNEPLIKNLQYPEIKSSLATPRKLCDPVLKSSSCNNILPWCSVKMPSICYEQNISALQVSISIEFSHHLNTFCNALDINVYMNIQKNARLFILTDIELDISFELPNKVIPTGSVFLKNCNLQVGAKNHLLTKTILDTQKIENENVSGCIVLKFCKAMKSQELPFSVNVIKIAKFKLFLNQFESSTSKSAVKCSFNNDLICEDLIKL